MIPLTLRSHYSLMYSAVSCAELCKQAKILGYTTIGLSDMNNLYGLWTFLAACRKYDIQPIIGAEIRTTSTRAFCLVKNQQGYRNLCRLITANRCTPTFSLATAARERLQGLVLLTDDSNLLTIWQEQNVDVAAALVNRPNQKNSILRKRARQWRIPACAICDMSFLHRQEPHAYHLLRAIAENCSLSRLPQQERLVADAFLASPQEYAHRFRMWPEVIQTSHVIAKRCRFQGPDFGLILPPYRNATVQKANWLLREAAFIGAQKRYGRSLSGKVVARLEHELQIIADMNFSGYFLVVRDIVRPVERTCGRGSGAASLVAYCLRITNVCPIKHNLYFERFLNPGRLDAPDIDIDFAWDERDKILQAILGDHGCRAAMVSNHVTLQPRMAIRETAKVYGLSATEINRVTRQLSGMRSFSKKTGELLEKLQSMPRLRNLAFEAPWPEILHRAGQIIGVPRNLSVHPGGIIITPEPVTNYVPVEYATKGVPIIQWEKNGAEEAGLVKIDLLGNRSLGVIRDTVKTIKNNGIRLDEHNWQPEDDPATQTTIKTGRTMGCFYIESPAMRLLQKKARRGDFEHLVIHSSIIRPAANEFIREYLRRLHGGRWVPLHPLIADTLSETHGIMVYQEDVSRVAVRLGFSDAEADRLRKIMSKKDKQQHFADYKNRFFIAATNKGVPLPTTEKIWTMMMSFDGYSFCKPHSASYAQVSFQAAWLKTHFPAEFMAAVLSNQGGYYSSFAYLSEARRMGLRILPPDVNSSHIEWIGRRQEIRVGFMAIQHLTEETGRRILQARRQQPFTGVLDVLQRVRPAEDEAKALIHAGALDTFSSCSRAGMLYLLAKWQSTRSLAVRSLFPLSFVPPALPPDDPQQRLRNEYRTLGFLCSRHPVLLFNAHRKQLQTVLACDIPSFAGSRERIRFLGWPVTGKIVGTKSGQPMEFLTFEDETDQVECTFFPDTYKRYCHLLHAKFPLLLEGFVEQDFAVSTLTICTASRIDNRPSCENRHTGQRRHAACFS